MKSLSVKDRNS